MHVVYLASKRARIAAIDTPESEYLVELWEDTL